MSTPSNERDYAAIIAKMNQEKAELEAENAKLKQANKSATKAGQLSLKVSEKGALSIYGGGRFPVTCYKELWLKILDIEKDIRVFIQENDSQLKSKSDETPEQAAARKAKTDEAVKNRKAS